jgi:hypothetical protein
MEDILPLPSIPIVEKRELIVDRYEGN